MNETVQIPEWAKNHRREYLEYANYSGAGSEDDNQAIRELLLKDLQNAVAPSPESVQTMQSQLSTLFQALNNESQFKAPIQSLYFIQDPENARFELSCYGEIKEPYFSQEISTKALNKGAGTQLSKAYKTAIDHQAHIDFLDNLDFDDYDQYDLEDCYEMKELSEDRMDTEFREALYAVLERGAFTNQEKFQFPVLVYIESEAELNEDYPETFAAIAAKIVQRGDTSSTRHEGNFNIYEVDAQEKHSDDPSATATHATKPQDLKYWALKPAIQKDGARLSDLPLNGPDDDEYFEGKILAGLFTNPHQPSMSYDPELPGRDKLYDFIVNRAGLLIASSKVREVLDALEINGVEYLPIWLEDHDNKVVSKEYVILNVIDKADFINIQKTKYSAKRSIKGQISRFKGLFLNSDRVPDNAKIFRATAKPDEIFIRDDVKRALEDAGITGYKVIEANSYIKPA